MSKTSFPVTLHEICLSLPGVFTLCSRCLFLSYVSSQRPSLSSLGIPFLVETPNKTF